MAGAAFVVTAALGTAAIPATVLAQDASASPAAGDAAAARIAELRSKLEGQSIVFGEGGFQNPQIVVFYKIADLLQQEFGLNVDARATDADPLVAALVAGQAQVGSLSIALIANTNTAGADFVAFGADQSRNTFDIAAKAPITTMEELRGKPFGGPQNLASITGQTVQRCFKDAGMDLEKDVQLLRFNNTGESQAALTSDQVAGAITMAVRITPLMLEDPSVTYDILCRGNDVNPQIGSALVATRDFIANNPDLIEAITIASIQANRWAADDKQGWIDLAVSKLQGYTPEAGAIDWENLVQVVDMWPVNGGLLRDDCDKTLATSFEFGVTTEQLTCDDVATFEFQDRAVELLGAR